MASIEINSGTLAGHHLNVAFHIETTFTEPYTITILVSLPPYIFHAALPVELF